MSFTKISLLCTIHSDIFYSVLFSSIFYNRFLNAKQLHSPLMNNKPQFENNWFKGHKQITKIKFTLYSLFIFNAYIFPS